MVHKHGSIRLDVSKQQSCNDKFRWLEHNMLYHENSNMCLDADLKMTYNCFSWEAVQILTHEHKLMTPKGGARCWKNSKGKIMRDSCDSASAGKFKFE